MMSQQAKPGIIVTGANGQLGRELRDLAEKHPSYTFSFFSRDELAIDDREHVSKIFSELKPSWLINCAAYTAVDKAENEKEKAFLINAQAAGLLAAACSRERCRMIHISTDYVFDGTSEKPLKETDPTGPINIYGASKLAGEKEVMEHNPDAIIIRTAWVYSAYGNNFVKTMLRLMSEKELINVVDDQIGSPTYAKELAEAILFIIESGKNAGGIFHYSSEGKISWYQFALAIKEITGSSCIVSPIPSSGFPTPAKRPGYSLLDKTKIKTVYGLSIPGWRTGLEKCFEKIQALKSGEQKN